MKTRKISAWIMLATAFLAGPARAQFPDWEQYTNGSHITALAEAGNDLWVGTTGGLVQVDRNSRQAIQYFNTANSGLPSNHITALVYDSLRNQLWIGTFGKGVARYGGSPVFRVFRRDSVGSDTINALTLFNGNLWVGTFKGLGRMNLASQVWLAPISGANSLPSDTVTSLAQGAGFLWVGTRRGIVRSDGVQFVDMSINLINRSITGVAVDRDGFAWLATAGGGAAKQEMTSWRIFDTASTGGGLPSALLKCITADTAAGVIWVGTDYSGLSRYDGTSWTYQDTSRSGIPTNEVTAVLPSASGALWVGTGTGGLAQLTGDSTWATVNLADMGLDSEGLIAAAVTGTSARWACSADRIYYFDGVTGNAWSAGSLGLVDGEFTSLALDAQGRAWVGTYGNGVLHYNGTGWTPYSLDNVTTGFPDDFVNSVAVSPVNGDVWIGTFNGVGRYNGSVWTTFNMSSTPPLPAGTYEIQDVSVGGDGTVWISDFQSPGPIRFSGTAWVQTDGSSVGITPGSIQSLWADSTGGVWVGTYSSGIARHSGGTWGSHLTTALPSQNIRSITSDVDGNLWLGTAGGLARVIPPTGVAGATVSNIYRVGNSGIPANSVRSVSVGPDNRVYVATDSGGAVFSGFMRVPEPQEPALTIRTRYFMFDTLAPGGSDTLRTFIVNTGTGALTIDSLYILQNGPLAYSLIPPTTTAPPAITVPAGDSIVVAVRFTPFEVAFHAGQVRVVSNSPGSPDIIYLGGSVRAPSLTFAGDEVHVHTGLYAFFSIPYVLEDSRIATVLESLGTYGGSNWRLFYYKNGNYLEYPNFRAVDSLSFKPGIAYWLIAREALNLTLRNVSETPAIQRTGTGPTDWTTVNYRITLRPGWNMIGNPFAYSINWSRIIAATGAPSTSLQAPVVYNVRWEDYGLDPYAYNQTVLEPWRGYFVYNRTTAPIVLQVPPMPGTPKASPPRRMDRQEFILELSASGVESKLRSGKTRVGMLRTAEDGMDPEDYLEAPPIGERLILSATDAKGNRYAGNFMAVSGEGGSWDIELKPSDRDRRVTVKIGGLDGLPAGFKTWLIDTDSECCLDLKDGAAEADVPKDGTGLHLKLIVGTEEYAESAGRGLPLEPYKFGLKSNYPNPFNPETRIEYSLERKSRVSVDVFDGLGRKIRTLESGVLGAGVHEAVWNGRDDSGRPVPSGVYVCRVRAGAFATSRKMALIR
ncbi:MAG: two-component regulator propeller domain-containing protein [bacterium]|nr:two-component regulator propeller domain-containing protein [bacterium]